MRNLLSILLFYSLSFSQYSYTVTLNCSAFSPNVCERGNGFSGAVSTVNFSYNSNSAKITCKATNVVKDDMVSFPPGFTVSQVPVPSGSCDLDYTRNGVSEPRHSNVAGNSCTAGSSESFWADRCWSAASLGSVTISLVGSSPLECPNPNPSIDASFCPRPVPEEHSGYCSSTQEGAGELESTHRSSCADGGGSYSGTVFRHDYGYWCVSGNCNDGCEKDGQYLFNLILANSNCCASEKEPNDDFGSYGICTLPLSGGIGVSYPIYESSALTECSLNPAGSGNNYCGINENDFCTQNPTHQDCVCLSNPNDPSCVNYSITPDNPVCGGDSSDSGEDVSSDSGEESSSVSESDESSGSNDGESSGSGEDVSSDSGADVSSGSEGDGTSSGSGDGGSSASGGYWCDHNPDDPICTLAGHDDYCTTHPSDPYCEWSLRCSHNPHDPLCVNPQPPPYYPSSGSVGGGASSGSGDGASSGGNPPPLSSGSSVPPDSSGFGGISCKDLKSCDWSTLETQLKQVGIEQSILGKLEELYPWLQRKSREDSLLSAHRWLDEKKYRDTVSAAMETLNGLVYAGNAIASEQLKALNRMDSANGLYYAASLSASSALSGSLDALVSSLEGLLSDGSLFPDKCDLNPHLVDCGGSGVSVDMSGVESGLSALSGNVSGLGDRLDSVLSSGNGNIMGLLNDVFGDGVGTCTGESCGDYAGIGDGVFAGYDTSGISAARWDSLLSAPGSVGLQDSAAALSSRLRAATATPFADGMACPEESLSVNLCEPLGGTCVFSVCDRMLYIQGRHFIEWLGVFMEFAAWVMFLIAIA